jgi:predicted Ser/Thr protein kinase
VTPDPVPEPPPSLPSPAPSPDPGRGQVAVGRRVGDYRLVRIVGRGGTGVVYEAEQLSLQRRVALKVLDAHLAASPAARERFRREAAAASRLRHNAIVPIHEVGESHGVHWFSMEFVKGTPLQDAMQNERLGRAGASRTAVVAELVAQLAAAVHHAHERGLVHRDIKPANVLLTPDGGVRLLDFGVAKDTLDTAVTRTGEFHGTPHYSSPEQASGVGIGPATDVFALGILLYELLARRRPFEAEHPRLVLRRIESGVFVPLRQAAPAVPRDLETICHHALAPRPSDRYATAAALAADLERFLRLEPILAVPPGVVRRSWQWLRRHRLVVLFVALVAGTVLGAPAAWALHVHTTRTAIEHERAVLRDTEAFALQGIERMLMVLSQRVDRLPAPEVGHAARLEEVVQLCASFLDLAAGDPVRCLAVATALIDCAAIHAHLGQVPAGRAACARAAALLAQAEAAGVVVAAGVRARLLLRELVLAQVAEADGGDALFASVRAHWQTRREPLPRDELLLQAETWLQRARALADRRECTADAASLLETVAHRLQPLLVEGCAEAEMLAARAGALAGRVAVQVERGEPALQRLQAAAAALARLPAEPVLAVEVALTQGAIGHVLQRLGRAAESEEALRGAIARGTRLAAAWPGSADLRRAVLGSRILLGGQLLVQG